MFLTFKMWTVTADEPTPPFPTIVRIDPSKPATIDVGFHSEADMELKTSNVRLLEMDFEKLLESYGWSKQQISNYNAKIVNQASTFSLKTNGNSVTIYVFDFPKSWKIKDYQINGGKPEGSRLAPETTQLIFVAESQPATLTLQLEPAVQASVNATAMLAGGIIATSLIASTAKELIRAFREKP